MKFGTLQKMKFGTANGSYSIVTEREHFDSQVTLTDYEAELVLSHFGRANIQVGPVAKNRPLSSKEFRLYPDGRKIKLNVNHPKPDDNELRLYLSSTAGFKPKGGNVWLMFVKEGEIWIGAMPEEQWRSESSELKQDESDEAYQSAIESVDAARIARLKGRDVYQRDRKIALKKMELSGYKCEFDQSHQVFVSRFSGMPYLEAHHLIPISIQADFKLKLDNIHNVFCLCPHCHRAVHHAEVPLARDILSNLADKSHMLTKLDLSVPDLFSLYAVEEIGK